MAWHFSRAGGWADEKFACENCWRAKLHRVRNCTRYFPSDVVPSRTSWAHHISVSITGRKGERINRSAVVQGSQSDECPVSAITPHSQWMLELVQGSRMAKEQTGACLYGPDTRHWPAWYFDAVRVVHVASIAEDEARMKAQR